MNILFIIKVWILVLIKKSPQLCWLLNLVYHILSLQSNFFETHAFLVFILGATPNHIPLVSWSPIKISNQIRHVYLNQ